jgi:hypothetical protein
MVHHVKADRKGRIFPCSRNGFDMRAEVGGGVVRGQWGMGGGGRLRGEMTLTFGLYLHRGWKMEGGGWRVEEGEGEGCRWRIKSGGRSEKDEGRRLEGRGWRVKGGWRGRVQVEDEEWRVEGEG